MKYYKLGKAVFQSEDKPNGAVEITKAKFDKFNELVDTLNNLKFELSKTDYVILEEREDDLNGKDIDKIKADRKELRAKIRELESELEKL